MGGGSLTGRRIRRVIGVRYLRWRTLRGRETAVRYLGLLAVALERHGWRWAMCCPEWMPAGTPLLRIY
ncbi:hypothetical protein [Actinomadura sp. 7K507]|uniref:hypothetical protein n=1 Tax=Actinomadura sp. 7K507 TaxID=2530365 RepID=UPI001FB76638|nr:hypothetical protein [Actinomadura sp. 7K507]